MHASPFLFVIIHRGLRWSVLLRKSNYRSHLSVSVHHECIACFLRCNANRHFHNKAQRDFGTGFRRGLPIEKKYPNTDYKGCLHQVKMRQNQTFLSFSEYIDTRPSTEKVLPVLLHDPRSCGALNLSQRTKKIPLVMTVATLNHLHVQMFLLTLWRPLWSPKQRRHKNYGISRHFRIERPCQKLPLNYCNSQSKYKGRKFDTAPYKYV